MSSKMNWAKPLFLATCCLSAASVLVACGGGGGGGGGGGAASAPVLPTTTVKAAVDGDRSATPNGQLVTTVSSPFGNAPIGGDVSVAKASVDAATLMIGTDAGGSERLLRFEQGDGPLSADTTAYALVRLGLILADRPAGLSATRAASLIRTSAAYGGVVDAVKASLAANTSGGTAGSQDVVDKVGLAVLDVLQLAARAAAGTQSTQPLKASVTGTPYYFWNKAADDQTWLTQGPLTFNNRTFIYWRLSAKSAAGSWEATVRPLESTAAQLAALYGGSESKTAIQPPGDRFTLTLDQSPKTQLNNATAAVVRSTSALVEVLMGATEAKSTGLQECVMDAANEIVTHNDFAPLLTNFSVSGLFDFIWDSKFSFVHTLISSCGKKDDAEDSVWKRFSNLAAVKTIGKVYTALEAARTTASAYGTMAQFATYSHHSQSVDICLKEGQVSSCPDIPVVPPVTAPVVPPVAPGATNCQPALDPLAVEFDAINARRPASASLVADLQVLMYMTDKMVTTLELYCKADAGNYSTIGFYRDTYNAAQSTCTQVATHAGVCVPSVPW